jgi:hypothetical protein
MRHLLLLLLLLLLLCIRRDSLLCALLAPCSLSCTAVFLYTAVQFYCVYSTGLYFLRIYRYTVNIRARGGLPVF